MSAPRVHNKYHLDAPAGSVYIGRGSPWGNTFVIGPVNEGKHGTRDEVIALHREWLLDRPDMLVRVQEELAGRSLVCFCFPKACHGDVLLEVANANIPHPRRTPSESPPSTP